MDPLVLATIVVVVPVIAPAPSPCLPAAGGEGPPDPSAPLS